MEDKSFIDKAVSYAKIESSQLFHGKVSKEIFEKRKESCITCTRLMNPTPETEEIGWCTTCGCSANNPRAALSNKLWMPDLECPLNKFPQEKGEGFNVTDAANSAKGTIQSLISLMSLTGNT